jgi:hypothetical protein
LRSLPEAEQQVIKKAMAKKSDERYSSCLAFAQALAVALAPILQPDAPLLPLQQLSADETTEQTTASVAGMTTSHPSGQEAGQEAAPPEVLWKRTGQCTPPRPAPIFSRLGAWLCRTFGGR